MTGTPASALVALALSGILSGPPYDDTGREASGAEIGRFLESWSARSKETTSLDIRFRQEKRLRILRRPLVSTGRIRIAGGTIRCEVRDASERPESITVVTEDRLRIYYPRLGRVETYELGRAAAPALALPFFGSDPATLQRDFELSMSVPEAGDGTDEPRRRLVLTARSEDAPIRWITLVFDGLEVREVEQKDRNGDRVRMVLEEVRRDPDLRPEDLELRVPPGTKEVRPARRPGGDRDT